MPLYLNNAGGGGGGGSGLPDAPSNGLVHGRLDGNWVGLPESISLSKPEDTEIIGSASWADDPHLVIPVLTANAMYRLEYGLLWSASVAGDIRYRFNRTGLADADLRFATDNDNESAATYTFGNTRTLVGSGAAAYRMTSGFGVLIVGSDPGQVQFQWAQATSDAVESARLRAGSMILLQRVS